MARTCDAFTIQNRKLFLKTSSHCYEYWNLNGHAVTEMDMGADNRELCVPVDWSDQLSNVT